MKRMIVVTFRPGYGRDAPKDVKRFRDVDSYELSEVYTDTFKLDLFYGEGESRKKRTLFIPRASLHFLEDTENPQDKAPLAQPDRG